MQEQAFQELMNISPILGVLFLAIVGLVLYVKMMDKRNMSITNERINDLKEEVKIMKQENKEDKKTLRLAVETFDRTTREFQAINSNLNDMKTDISIIKEKLK